MTADFPAAARAGSQSVRDPGAMDERSRTRCVCAGAWSFDRSRATS